MANGVLFDICAISIAVMRACTRALLLSLSLSLSLVYAQRRHVKWHVAAISNCSRNATDRRHTACLARVLSRVYLAHFYFSLFNRHTQKGNQ